MALVIWGGLNPPDDSGTWIDDGWGNWTQDTSIVGTVPNGFYDDGWGNLAPIDVNPSLDAKTVESINNTLKDAKAFKDTQVGKVLYTILAVGERVIDDLIKIKGLKDPTAPISYENIDKVALEKALKEGKLKQTVYYPESQAPVNSTYFGIDFSKPLTWIIVLLAVWGLYKLFNSSPPMQTVSPKKN